MKLPEINGPIKHFEKVKYMPFTVNVKHEIVENKYSEI